jgi:hypothetical protein
VKRTDGEHRDILCKFNVKDKDSLPDTPRLILTLANDQYSDLPRACHHIRTVGALPGHGAIGLLTQFALAAWATL